MNSAPKKTRTAIRVTPDIVSEHSPFDSIAFMLRRILWIAVLAAFTALAAEKPGLDGFDSFADQILKDWKCVGMAVAVIQDGKVVLAKGYGMRDMKNNKPVTTK